MWWLFLQNPETLETPLTPLFLSHPSLIHQQTRCTLLWRYISRIQPHVTSSPSTSLDYATVLSAMGFSSSILTASILGPLELTLKITARVTLLKSIQFLLLLPQKLPCGFLSHSEWNAKSSHSRQGSPWSGPLPYLCDPVTPIHLSATTLPFQTSP